MNCFCGSQFPMNHQSHSLSEIQIWTWPELESVNSVVCRHLVHHLGQVKTVIRRAQESQSRRRKMCINDGLPLSCAFAPTQVKKMENLIIRVAQESQSSDVVGGWRCFYDGLPLSCAFSLLCGLLCFPKAPGANIGFNGHFPCKVALKILLRHSAAAGDEVIIVFESLADGPLSVEVDVPPIGILLFISCLTPLQHALLPSEISNSVRKIRCVAACRYPGTIRSRQKYQILDLLVADRQRLLRDHRSCASMAPYGSDLLLDDALGTYGNVGVPELVEETLV